MKHSGIEWIGEIPDDWKIVYLSSIFNEHKRKNMGLICKNLLSLSYGKIKRKDINTTDGLLPESFEGYNIIENGDIVLRLTDLQNDQKSLRTGIAHETGLITSAYITIRCLPKIALPDYMHYYLHSFDTSKGFYGMGDGVRQGLNYDGIKKILMLLPPINEQPKIADYLDKKCAAVDRLIENQRAQIEKLKEYKQSVITEAVTRGLDPSAPLKDSGVEWLGKIPENFNIRKLKNICKIFGRIGFRGYRQDDLVEEGEGAITISPSNMRDAKMDYSKCTYLSWGKYYESPEIQIKKGDILFVKTGSTYGKIALVSDLPMEATINPQLVVLKNFNVHNSYLCYFLQTYHIQSQVKITVVGGTIPTIAQDKISRYDVIVPPLEEQQQIADYLDKKCAEIDKLISIKQQKIETLTEYKKSLIYEYVTGKKQVG